MMKIKISRIAMSNNKPKAFTVKVKGKKYPRGYREWYFPQDNKPETAIEMALIDYKKLLLNGE